MPEGPEIRLAADEIESVLKGRKTKEVWFAFKDLKKYQKQLTGAKVRSVQTRGKAMLTVFDNELVIYSHNQLYGRWMTAQAGRQPDTGRQLRLAIHNAKASAFLYSASDIEVLKASQLDAHPFLARLGPDLLSEQPSPSALVERLESERFRKRQLAGLLLDQGFVAGLGNYLRAEILLHAGVHPKRRPVDCDRNELKRVATQTVKLTQRSYQTGGIINAPKLVKELKAQGLTKKEEHRYSAYRREGKPCYHCGTSIERIDAGGRHIYFCPGCQTA